MDDKAQSLERRISMGESIFDIARDPSMDISLEWAQEIDKILRWQDTASELQIEKAKNQALDALLDILISCDDFQARTRAATGLLQFYRSEKQRLEARRKEKAENPDEELFGQAKDIFGPWRVKSPAK